MEIEIEMYRGSADVRQGLQLDIGCIVTRLSQTFPSIEFEEEYFQRHIEIIRQITAEQSEKTALNIAIHDAEERGPGFRFRVVSSGSSSLRGGFSRYCLTFRFDETVDPELIVRAEQFLDSFGLNKFKNITTDADKKKDRP